MSLDVLLRWMQFGLCFRVHFKKKEAREHSVGVFGTKRAKSMFAFEVTLGMVTFGYLFKSFKSMYVYLFCILFDHICLRPFGYVDLRSIVVIYNFQPFVYTINERT